MEGIYVSKLAISNAILNKIQHSATLHTQRTFEHRKASSHVIDQVKSLIGYDFTTKHMHTPEKLKLIIQILNENLRTERIKSLNCSNSYNNNRHIALHDLLIHIKLKHDELITHRALIT